MTLYPFQYPEKIDLPITTSSVARMPSVVPPPEISAQHVDKASYWRNSKTRFDRLSTLERAASWNNWTEDELMMQLAIATGICMEKHNKNGI